MSGLWISSLVSSLLSLRLHVDTCDQQSHTYILPDCPYIHKTKIDIIYKQAKQPEKQQMANIKTRGPSEQQQAFIDYLVNNVSTPTEAARQAGYAHPRQSAYILTRTPHVMAAVRQARQTVYQSELASLSVDTLKRVMRDDDAPASAKVSAARTALELAGDIGKAADDITSSKQLAEMSPDELSSLIDKWEGERASLATDITPAADKT